MPTTATLTCRAVDSGNNPVAGGLWRATLKRRDPATGKIVRFSARALEVFVVSEVVEAVGNEAGVATLQLVKNTGMLAGSFYHVLCTNPDDGATVVDRFVPLFEDAELAEAAQLEPPSSPSEAQAMAEAARDHEIQAARWAQGFDSPDGSEFSKSAKGWALDARDAEQSILGNAGFQAVAGALDGDIHTVAEGVADVAVVASSIDAVASVADSISDVNAVAQNAPNVNAVAARIEDVQTVSGVAGNVVTVAGIAPKVATVADAQTNVNTVAGIAPNVTTVASIAGNVSAVAGIAPNVTTVAGMAGNVATVAGISAAVSAVAGNGANISAVAARGTDVSAVAARINDVQAVSGISGNVTVVAGIAGSVQAVAGNATNVNAVAGSVGNVNIVAGSVDSVNAVAGNLLAVQAAPGAAITATAGANSASISSGTASAAAARAEAARDSTITTAGLAVDEPTGRLTVADGQTFSVQGSGDVGALVYRRVNAATVSTLVTSYPAARIQYATGLRNTLPNLYAEATVDISSMPDRYVDVGVAQATVAASTIGFMPCWRAQVGTNSTASVAWRFPISSLAGQPVFSCALRILAVDAANGSTGNRSVRMIVSQIDGAGAGIAGTSQTVVLRDQNASTGEIQFALESQSVNVSAVSVQIRLEIQNANGTAVRNVYFRDPLMAAGPLATFRRPPDARATAAEAIAGTDASKIVPPSALAAAIASALTTPNSTLATHGATIDLLIEAMTSQRVAMPSWLMWPDRYPIFCYRTPAGLYKVLVNLAYVRSFVDARIWTVTPYYVDASRADDTGDGLTWATAKKRINAAITAANADAQPAMRIIIKGGPNNVYTQSLSINGNSGLTGVEPTKPCGLLSDGQRVRHVASTSETFPSTKNATFTNTYVGGPSSATWVIDLTNLTNGRPTPIPQQADAAAVDAAVGGGWVVSNATGTTLTHIRRSDGLQPTPQNTAVLRNIHVSAFDSCTTDVYLEGIDFIGGPFGACWFDAIATRNIVDVDCTFRFGGTSLNLLDGFRVRRTSGLVLSWKGDAASNWKDGWNYHYDNGPVGGKMYVLQIDCTGEDNGRAGSSSNNSFTTHDDVIAVDVSGVYGPTNDGANFHVIEDTLTLAIGTSVTTDTGGDTQRAAFKASNNAKLGLLGTKATCPAAGDYAIYAQGAAGRVYTFEHSTLIGSNIADTGGSIVNSASLTAFLAG